MSGLGFIGKSFVPVHVEWCCLATRFCAGKVGPISCHGTSWLSLLHGIDALLWLQLIPPTDDHLLFCLSVPFSILPSFYQAINQSVRPACLPAMP
jgi:hypothetical protein